ncbi:MAG: hypothetical protein KJ957_00675 [Candidatus Omnitrophica bacterium]|nr:hypothetical protein [Candidatus Omnitrophota bacterium]
MVKENRIVIFIIGFLFAWILFSSSSRNAIGQSTLPSSIAFSGESNVMYFLDRDNAKIYRYNTQGRLTRIYTVKELGKDLESN